MPWLFTAGLLSWALSLGNGNIEIYIFFEKYLHDFRYKNMLRISINHRQLVRYENERPEVYF
jgi:hypothetical protein